MRRLPILGYEGRYDIAENGEVRSLNYMHTGRPAPLVPVNYKGYRRVYLYDGLTQRRKRFMIHRLVAQAFIPNPEGKPLVNHRNGDKARNHWRNLEWATHAENVLHAMQVLKRGLPAKAANSLHSKKFEVRLPAGRHVTAHGLKAFCDKHGLDRRAMLRTLKGICHQHKGYSLVKELS